MSDTSIIQTRTMAKPTITSEASGLLPRAAVNSSSVSEAPPIVHEVLRSPGQPLDAATRAFMEPRFGHDFSTVRVHTDAKAAASAHAVRALAYTVGRDVVFGVGQYQPDTAMGQHLLTHELTHVMQQRWKDDVEPRPHLEVGPANDVHEREAEHIASSVMQQFPSSGISTRPRPALQRFAFINEKQVGTGQKDFTPEMAKMVSDTIVRNYTGIDEFKQHASKKTDYLGNLADGTWLRFEPTGTNLLGENHTKVNFEMVMPAVGSRSFLFEQLSSDVQKAGSNIKAAYETENMEMFKKLGIEKEKDKQPFGAESLFPKMGFALNIAIPYFQGKKPMNELGSSQYVGKPVQRYLKIGWGYSKDNKISVEQNQKAKKKSPAKLEALAKVHASVEVQLDKFIIGLAVDGYIGDVLKEKKNTGLLPPLAKFTEAFTEAMVELAASEKSSRLTEAERKTLSGGKSLSPSEKETLFSNWRDFLFEDNVKAATKRGVRYAGMGQNHLDHLVAVGLEKNQHPFEMDGKDITAFKALTDKLTKSAKKP